MRRHAKRSSEFRCRRAPQQRTWASPHLPKSLPRRDLSAAARLITGLPWNAHCYWQMKSVAQAWLKADLEAARRWIEAEPYVQDETRERLIKEDGGQLRSQATLTSNELRRDTHCSRFPVPRRRNRGRLACPAKHRTLRRLLREMAWPRPAHRPPGLGNRMA